MDEFDKLKAEQERLTSIYVASKGQDPVARAALSKVTAALQSEAEKRQVSQDAEANDGYTITGDDYIDRLDGGMFHKRERPKPANPLGPMMVTGPSAQVQQPAPTQLQAVTPEERALATAGRLKLGPVAGYKVVEPDDLMKELHPKLEALQKERAGIKVEEATPTKYKESLEALITKFGDRPTEIKLTPEQIDKRNSEILSGYSRRAVENMMDPTGGFKAYFAGKDAGKKYEADELAKLQGKHDRDMLLGKELINAEHFDIADLNKRKRDVYNDALAAFRDKNALFKDEVSIATGQQSRANSLAALQTGANQYTAEATNRRNEQIAQNEARIDIALKQLGVKQSLFNQFKQAIAAKKGISVDALPFEDQELALRASLAKEPPKDEVGINLLKKTHEAAIKRRLEAGEPLRVDAINAETLGTGRVGAPAK